jgi:hypothetical protein
MNDDETKEVLREIRDLQKAHFDRYVQVTEQLLRFQRRMWRALVVLLVLCLPLLLYFVTIIILSIAGVAV